jgi:ABC-type proline/glycine betaine transport system permease subunit
MRIHKPALMTALALVVILAAVCAAGVGASTLPSGACAND